MLLKQILLGLFIALCVSCANTSAPSPSEDEIATALVQVVAARTQTAEALPSATLTPGPTSTPSLTPLPPFAATGTAEAILTGPHGDGVYLVGSTIAAGVWRSFPEQERFCYWARRKYDGVVLGSHYGPPGGEILIRDTDYEVEFDGCGVWVYMGPR